MAPAYLTVRRRKGVTIMEGLILDIGTMETAFTFFGALCLLILAVSAIGFGAMAEGEKSGLRFSWAEWPIPGTEETEDVKDTVVPIRRAA